MGGDYHLQQYSPCIDAGDNAALPPDTTDLDNDGNTTEPIPVDQDGEPRIIDGVVDMGVYEYVYQTPGDELGVYFDGDGKSDILWQNSSTGQVYIWLMNGTSIKSAGSAGGVTSDWVIKEMGDCDGDGMADILWRNSITGQTYIWLMNGTSVKSAGSAGGAALVWKIISS